MNETRRNVLLCIVLAGVVVAVAACAPASPEAPSAQRVETVSLRIEGMT